MSSAEALAMKHYSGVFFSSFYLRMVAFKKLLSSKICFLESVYILFFSQMQISHRDLNTLHLCDTFCQKLSNCSVL